MSVNYVDKTTVDGVSYDYRDSGAVRFDEEQSLTSAQKSVAQGNIGAASEDVISVQSAQPTVSGNRIWIQSGDGDEVEVPDIDEFNDLKSQMTDITGNTAIPVDYVNKYIDTSGNTVDITNIHNTTSGNRLSIVSCSAGDVFTINARGADQGRAYAFVSSNGTNLERASASATVNGTLIAPEESAYLIINNRDGDRISYYGKLLKYKAVEAREVIDEFTSIMDLNNMTESVTLYPTQGYIRESKGDVVPTNGYFVYYFTVPVEGLFWFSTIPANGVFTSCGICRDTFGTGIIHFFSNSRGNLPTEASKVVVQKGNVIEICIPTTYTFNAKCSTVLQVNQSNLQAKDYLVVVPYTATFFSVFVCKNDHYYSYGFSRRTTTAEIQSQEMTTMDAWDVSIYNESNEKIMQGNFNFVHNLSAPTGHTGYVGAGDGCAVMDWFTFYADGKPFIPGTTTERIWCKEFRYVTKLTQYLSDGTQATGTIPSIDGQGNPIIESYNTMDCRITSTGVHGRNRMLMQIDGVRFSECHGAMLTGYYPFFDNIIILNKEMTWNKMVESGGSFSVSLEGGSTIDLSQNGGYKKGDTAILYGDNIIASCTMRNVIMGNVNKSNFRIWLPPNTDNRMKAYMMPVVTTHSHENIADGEPVDEFNAGDMIDVEYEKVIRYYDD